MEEIRARWVSERRERQLPDATRPAAFRAEQREENGMFHEMVPQPKMLIVIAAYFLAVFAFAYLAKKKENRKSIKDFALAGKGLGSFILMATFMAPGWAAALCR